MLLGGVLLLGGQGEQGRPGREVKGKLQHGLVKSSAFHTPADRSLMSILGKCKERNSSPGGLSHGNPSTPAVLSPFDQPGTQEDGRLQVAPHKGSARTAAVAEGVEGRRGCPRLATTA